MSPADLIPVPDVIPVHWGWIHFFLILTFTLHLLCMNIMLGIGIIALIQSFSRRPGTVETNRQVSAKLPYTIAFTVNLGVAPLLFIQVLYGQFIYTSSVLMGVYWLSIVLMLLLAYYSAYLFEFRFDPPASRGTVFIAVSVTLLLVVGFFFSNNMTLMLTPETWLRYFDRPGGTLLNLSEPSLIPRYLHVVLSALAVGGLFLAILWHMKERRSGTSCRKQIKQSLSWFSHATLFQFIVGTWFLLSLPKDLSDLFMGGLSYATTLFALAMAGTVASLFFAFKKKVVPCAVAAVVTVVLMILMRDVLRSAYLSPYFHPSTLKSVPQYGSFFLFLAFLIIGVLLVGVMLRLAFKDKRAQEEPS